MNNFGLNKMMNIKQAWVTLVGAALLVFALAHAAEGITRVRDIARPLGERGNKLIGRGLVIGLAGTGDSAANPSLVAMLQRLGENIAPGEEIKSKNVAEVIVTAELGRNGSRDGDEINVYVDSIRDAKSLEGGKLVLTALRGAYVEDDRIIGWAQGPVSTPNASKPSGVVKNGAHIEIDFYHNYINYENDGSANFMLILDDDQSSFQVAKNIAMIINEETSDPGVAMGQANIDTGMSETAMALDARNIRVEIPKRQLRNPTMFIAQIMNLPVELPDPPAAVVIHERTGSIVFTGNVEIAPAIVSVDGMVIRVVEPEPEPAPGRPVVRTTEWANMSTVEAGKTVNIRNLIDSLDLLNVSTEGKIKAIYALKDAGALRAEIITEH